MVSAAVFPMADRRYRKACRRSAAARCAPPGHAGRGADCRLLAPCVPARPRCRSLTAALRIGFSQAWRALVAAEMVGATKGIGWMVSMGGQVGNSSQVLLGIALIGLIAWLMESLVFRRIERHYQALACTLTRHNNATEDSALPHFRSRKPKPVDYIAPVGLYERNRAPSLPRQPVACERTELIAGEWTELPLTYTVGGSGLADGAWLKLAFKFYSDWALFQTSDAIGRQLRLGRISRRRTGARPKPGHGAAAQSALRPERPRTSVPEGRHHRYRRWLPESRRPHRHPPRRPAPGRCRHARAELCRTGISGLRMFIDPLGSSKFAEVPADSAASTSCLAHRPCIADRHAAPARQRGSRSTSSCAPTTCGATPAATCRWPGTLAADRHRTAASARAPDFTLAQSRLGRRARERA
jgi:hypothetical protein